MCRATHGSTQILKSGADSKNLPPLNIVEYCIEYCADAVRLAETHDTPISSLKLEFYNGKVQPCKLTVDNPRKNPVLYFLTHFLFDRSQNKRKRGKFAFDDIVLF